MPSRHRVITTRDIARHCGVSTWTVAAALRGAKGVSAQTAARIREAATALGYDPQLTQAARRMLAQRHGTRKVNHLVALCFPAHTFEQTIESQFFGGLFRGIMAELVQHGFGLLCYEPIPTAEGVTIPILPAFGQGDVDGLIIYPQYAAADHLTALRALPAFGDRPIVSLFVASTGCATVCADYAGGTAAAMHRLLTLGHRHFLQFDFSQRGDPRIDSRVDAITHCLQAVGLNPQQHVQYYPLPMSPSWLSWRPDQKHPADQDARDTFIAYLRAHPEITAILALNDNNARHVAMALQQQQWQIPQDYSLVGFDDTDPLLNHAGDNILSSIRLPLPLMGKEAVRLLLSHIAHEELLPQTLMLPVDFIARDSIGPAPVR